MVAGTLVMLAITIHGSEILPVKPKRTSHEIRILETKFKFEQKNEFNIPTFDHTILFLLHFEYILSIVNNNRNAAMPSALMPSKHFEPQRGYFKLAKFFAKKISSWYDIPVSVCETLLLYLNSSHTLHPTPVSYLSHTLSFFTKETIII